MTEALRNGLAYALRGTKDCLYGFIKIYELQKTSSDNAQNDVKPSNRRQTVLSQRREEGASKNSVRSRSVNIMIVSIRVIGCVCWLTSEHFFAVTMSLELLTEYFNAACGTEVSFGFVTSRSYWCSAFCSSIIDELCTL